METSKTFALMNQPIDYQLAIHILNYEDKYGKDSFAKDLEIVKDLIEVASSHKIYRVMYGFVQYYGTDVLEQWIKQKQIAA